MLVEGHVIKVAWFDGERGGYVVADQFEPPVLLGCKGFAAPLLLFCQPYRETSIDGLAVGFQYGVAIFIAFNCLTNQRNKVG